MDHIPKAKGAGRDTDRTKTRQQQKREESREDLRDQSEIGLIAQRVGNRGLGGRDQPGVGWSQELPGFDWFVVAPREGGHSPGSTAAQGNPKEGTEGLGDRAEQREAGSGHGGREETSPGWGEVEETKWETKEYLGIRREADEHS